MGCKATFTAFLCKVQNPALGLVRGHKYWVSDQIFKFKTDVIEPLAPRLPPPWQRPDTPPTVEPPGGPKPPDSISDTSGTGLFPQAPLPGGSDGPFVPPAASAFFGRLLAYAYIEDQDRITLPIPTVIGHRYLTYQVCELDCSGGPATVACCSPMSPSTCMDGISAEECWATGGGAVFGKTCAEVDCDAIGSCCVPGACRRTTWECCETMGGDWLGMVPCLCTGACCGPDDCSDILESQCGDLPGFVWKGLGSSCADDCPIPMGSCCACFPGTPISLAHCVVTSRHNCLANDWEWIGSPECLPYPGECSPCAPPPWGACCTFGDAETCDGTCVDYVQNTDCLAPLGIFQGLYTTCNPAGKPCFRPSPCCAGMWQEDCYTAQSPLDCEQGGGIWHCGESCTPNSTVAGTCTRVCCLPNGACEYYSESRCLALGGVYHGETNNCADVDCGPCPQVTCCLPENQFGHCLCEQVCEQDCAQMGGTPLSHPVLADCLVEDNPVPCRYGPACDGPCGINPLSCCEEHATPGCNNDECCLCVCAIDPFCCDAALGAQWDDTCVQIAAGAGGTCFGVCGCG